MDFEVRLVEDNIYFIFDNVYTVRHAIGVAQGVSSLLKTHNCLHGDPPYWKEWWEKFLETKRYFILSKIYNDRDNIILSEAMTVYFPLDLFNGAATFLYDNHCTIEPHKK